MGAVPARFVTVTIDCLIWVVLTLEIVYNIFKTTLVLWENTSHPLLG